MAQSQQSLQELLEGLLGTRQVYFQAPVNVEMQYPAIVYKRDDILTFHADNKPYSMTDRYQIVYMDYDPDPPIIKELAALPMCNYVRSFAEDGLNHTIFDLYY